MTPYLRFFILALTPLLGVTSSFGPAVLFGLVATLLLVSVAGMVKVAGERLREEALLWSAVGLAVVLVTVLDALVSWWLPSTRSAWGVYLNLLAFAPLIVVWPLEQLRARSEVSGALTMGLLLTLLLLATAFVREVIGQGTFTLVPGTLAWPVPGLKKYPLTLLATGAGGFFLAATAVVAYRLWAPASEEPELAPVLPASSSSPAPTPTPTAQTVTQPASAPASESTEEWGETLQGVVADLSSAGNDKHRLLVIGSGNGELAYYLAMLCLDQAKNDKGFRFRIRGVDHFSTRVETALRGLYRDHQIEFIDTKVRDAWMTKGDGEDRFLWKVGSEPRLHVQFEVADFHQGQLFFPQPCQLIVLNQGIEYVTDDKKTQLLKTVCEQLVPGGALVVTGAFKRELLPEGMKRTGTTVFRKA